MSDFNDLFNLGGGFGASANSPQPDRAEKGVQIRGRNINGTYYVRAEDVVALLETNRLLPKITGKLKAAMRR